MIKAAGDKRHDSRIAGANNCIHATLQTIYIGSAQTGGTTMRRVARNLLTGLMMLGAASTAQASEYIARDHVVIDLKFGIEWLRCTVGQVWDGTGCTGKLVKLNPVSYTHLTLPTILLV